MLTFTKIQGAGNDFIVLNNINLHLPSAAFSAIAKKLCNRHASIGADGLMIVDTPDSSADFQMRFYNSDGSIGEMCGNGARCIARYAYENGIAPAEMTIQTVAGMVAARRITQRNYRVALNLPQVIALDYDQTIENTRYECSYIELGRPGLPHGVVRYDGLAQTDYPSLFLLGREFRYHPAFPKGANINFYEVLENNHVLIKTYERGVEDFTLACGSGSACTALTLFLKGQINASPIYVHQAGGILQIDIEQTEGQISGLFLTGDTNMIAQGTVLDEDLLLPQ